MQRKTLTLTAIAACAAAGLGTWYFLGAGTKVEYRTVAADHGDINVTISATGTPNAVVTVQVGSQISGTIQSLYADFNTKVTKGQIIARIDPAALQARVDQSQASLDAAKAAVANSEAGVNKAQAAIQASHATLAAASANVAKSEATATDAVTKLGRRTQLAKEGILSAEDLDTARTASNTASADQQAASAQRRAAEENIRVAEAELVSARTQLATSLAQVRQFEAALRTTQIDLDHTWIKAPVDGVVVARKIDVGQTVAASLATPTLFEIAQDLTRMQIDTNVAEADVGRARVGQPGTFTVDAYPGQIFKGIVTEIRLAPINVQNVISYDVVIAASNPDLRLFPGMTANVKILVTQRTGVLRIPNAALRYRPATVPKAAGREQAVWIPNAKGEPQRIAVTTGETDGNFTEITSGDLQPGTRVILSVLAKTATPAARTPTQGRGPGF